MIVVAVLYDTVTSSHALRRFCHWYCCWVQGHARAVHDLHVGDKALGDFGRVVLGFAVTLVIGSFFHSWKSGNI